MKSYERGGALLHDFSLTPDSTVLFAHAHPDDESVLTGHAIHALAEAGLAVYSYTASDGETSNEGDPLFVASGLRRYEADRAYDALGVPARNQHYAGLPDGWLVSQHKTMVEHLSSIMTHHAIDAVFTVDDDGYDGHPDHIAVQYAAAAAASRQRLPHWALLDSANPTSVNVLPVPSAKLHAIAQHRSQFPQQVNADSFDPRLLPYHSLIYLGEHYRSVGVDREKYAILKASSRGKHEAL